MELRASKWLSAALLVTYFVAMFPLLDRLDQVWEYASYVFEVTYVAAVWVLFYPKLSLRISRPRLALLEVVGAGVAGLAVYRLAGVLSLPIPFDLRSKELLGILLVIGPVIEEMVFRGALWELFARFVPSGTALVAVTTVVFSFAHFYAWWSVPAELHGFVVYQSVYVLVLGGYLGMRREKTRSIALPILIHVGFNFGFYLGFRT